MTCTVRRLLQGCRISGSTHTERLQKEQLSQGRRLNALTDAFSLASGLQKAMDAVAEDDDKKD